MEGADFFRLRSDGQSLIQESLFNKTLIVTTILVSYFHNHFKYNQWDVNLVIIGGQSNPYFMMKESDQILVGNDRFEGFVFDIIDEISKMLGFNYMFKLVEDSNWGSLNKITGEWNGMIRELLDGVRSIQQKFKNPQ